MGRRTDGRGWARIITNRGMAEMQADWEAEQPPLAPELVKIYIGQLPLDTDEPALHHWLLSLCDLREVRIIRGDTHRGPYSHFCYAFATVRASLPQAAQLIAALQQLRPHWRVNFKLDRPRRPPPLLYPPPYPPAYPFYASYYPPAPVSEKIAGEKPCRVMVRELWIGGIPQGIDRTALSTAMNHHGIVEDLQLFPRFAFVKFKQAAEATNAYERAQHLADALGAPPGLRLAFSDPAKRGGVVSNCSEFERQSPYLPILFIGFPAVTSANIELTVVKPICDEFGRIIAEYMRKSSGQNRSYFLFTYDCMKSAIRARQELRKRRDLLGDRRAEITLLLDEKTLLKGRDLSHTRRHYAPSPAPSRQQEQSDHDYYPYDPYMSHPYPQNYYHNYQPPSSIEQFINGITNCSQADLSEELLALTQGQQLTLLQETSREDAWREDAWKEEKEGEERLVKEREERLVKEKVEKEKQAIQREEKEKESKEREEKEKESKEREEKEKKEETQGEELNHKEKLWEGLLSWKNGKPIPITASHLSLPHNTTINIMSLIEKTERVSEDSQLIVLSDSEELNEMGKQLKGRAGVAFSSRFLAYFFEEEGKLKLQVERPSLMKTITRKLIRLD